MAKPGVRGRLDHLGQAKGDLMARYVPVVLVHTDLDTGPVLQQAYPQFFRAKE
jgi:hypothetical protein